MSIYMAFVHLSERVDLEGSAKSFKEVNIADMKEQT